MWSQVCLGRKGDPWVSPGHCDMLSLVSSHKVRHVFARHLGRSVAGSSRGNLSSLVCPGSQVGTPAQAWNLVEVHGGTTQSCVHLLSEVCGPFMPPLWRSPHGQRCLWHQLLRYLREALSLSSKVPSEGKVWACSLQCMSTTGWFRDHRTYPSWCSHVTSLLMSFMNLFHKWSVFQVYGNTPSILSAPAPGAPAK